YGGAPEGQREMLKRDLRQLERQGWRITNIAGAGDPARYRLESGDPRVQLYFDGPQRAEFERVAALAGVATAAVSASTTGQDAAVRLSVTRAPAYALALATHGHEHRCLLHFRYRDKQRTVSSDAIWVNQRRWYIVGREEVAGLAPEQWPSKQFRLDRVEELQLDRPGSAGPAVGTPHLNVDPLTFADGEPITAVVAVHPDHRGFAERLLGSAAAVDRDGDQMVLSIPVVSHATFRHRLYELGTRVRLIGPESLRAEVRADLLTHVRGR
ncbi:MAG: proteasome accessory factor, partial [Actinomycetota bacterium]|nr:proteasome accessory factor [Actinomycetota bacterium]